MKKTISLLLFWSAACSVFAGAAQQPAKQGDARPVILASRHDHRLEMFDAETLLPQGSIAVDNFASYAVATPDGRMLFFAAARPQDQNVCCALYALSLQTGSLCTLVFPALRGTLTTDGGKVLLQRGNTGIDVYDAHTLEHLPGIRGPGVYNLLPSPDGHWLFGVSSFLEPSLDIFSLDENRKVRGLPLPKTPAFWWDGAWLGNQFFLFGYDGKRGQLWKVLPESTDKGPKFCKQSGTCDSLPVALPDLAFNGKLPIMMRLVPAAESLYLYEPLGWWFKLNRRADVHKRFPGGIYRIDPATRKLTAHLHPEIDFAQVIADPSGKYLYAVDAGRQGETPVRLLKLDASSGEIVGTQLLEADFWSISFAKIPDTLIPRGGMRPQACAANTAAARIP